MNQQIRLHLTWLLLLGWPSLSLSQDAHTVARWLAPTRANPDRIQVNSYYGQYDIDGKLSGLPAPSLRGPVAEHWQVANKANKPYRIGVIFPHLKDPYWLAINYGIAYQAQKLGVSLDLKHPGGFRYLGKQVRQMEELLEGGRHQGLIIGPVQFKKSKMEKMFLRFQQAGIPIVSVGADSYTPSINGKVLVPYQDAGYQAGQFMVQHSAKRTIKVAVMPGPKGSGWAPDSLVGFKLALKELGATERVALLPTLWGDTGDKAQRHQVKVLLKTHHNIHYIVGNALAINAALTPGPDGSPAPLEEFKARHPNLQLISTYITPRVYDLIRQGKVLASPSDLMKDQGVIAMDMMVKILNGQKPGVHMPFRTGPRIPIIHQHNIQQWDYERLFGPRDFQAIFHLPVKQMSDDPR